MKTNKKKLFWKYLLGGLAGTVLCGAIAGGIVSCSNGSSSTSTTTSTNNVTSSTSNSNSEKSSSTTNNTTSPYELTNRYNTSSIAYANPQTNNMSLIADSNISNYNTLINEPNNVIISVLGQPEAVINVAHDTNSKTAPDITLDLNQNSQLFADVINGTNNKADLASLNNLITFTTTNKSTNKFNLNNYEGKYVSTQDIGLSNYQLDTFGSSANTIDKISINLDGLFGYTSMSTFWSDLHPANNGTPSLTITATNTLFWDNKTNTQTPFNFTINLLPLIKFSTQKTTLSISGNNGISYKGNTDGQIVPHPNKPLSTPAWNLVVNDTPITSNEFIYVNQTWYMNVPKDLDGFSITPIYVPATSKNMDTLNSVPYIYVDDNMYVVGMTTSSTIQ